MPQAPDRRPGVAHWLRRGWPIPALFAWCSAWLIWHQLPAPWDTVLALAPVLAVASVQDRSNRRLIVLGGFGLSLLLLQGMDRAPAWVWLTALLALLAAYPLGAWQDAPLFPTPAGALDDLTRHVHLAPHSRVLDAGCGTGDGLRALRSAFPQVQLEGIERSRLWALLCRLRCPTAVISHGDIWASSWGPYALVYLFQRPESMARAWKKACAEMADGSWLVSLEFPVPDCPPHAEWRVAGDRRVWVYRIGRSSPADGRPISRTSRKP